MTEEEIFSKVKSIIADQSGIDESEIDMKKYFIDDLELDSLDKVEGIIAVEDEFGIEIPEEDAGKITTVQQLVNYIVEHKK